MDQAPGRLKGFLQRHFNTQAAKATALFVTGALTNYMFRENPDTAQLAIMLAFLASAACYSFTKNRRWPIAVAGVTALSAQGGMALTADGDGFVQQLIGLSVPMIRSGFNVVAGLKRDIEPHLLNLVKSESILGHARNVGARSWNTMKRYPMVTGALIEIPFLSMLGYGAIKSEEWPMVAAIAQWILGNVELARSDKNFHEIVSKTYEIKDRVFGSEKNPGL